ncbi:unnamed protein product [Adineta ricciae]|uniref:Uncharacterized protein n=1 Tax=Adineta ricciae TaxID=249248 RepID=A0A815RHF2_ADIRI|nr:unnamed protein product [Adineta ricciae]
MVKLTKKDFQDYFVKFVAECFATCILILIGEGGIANYKFARQPTHSTFPISRSFAAGVYSALMIAGSINGVHLNPAAHGAVLVYTVYRNQFNEFDGGIRQMTGPNGTADIFFTMSGKGVSYFNTFIDQVISTSLLMIYIMAITHKKNHLISKVAKPFAFVLIIIGITSVPFQSMLGQH